MTAAARRVFAKLAGGAAGGLLACATAEPYDSYLSRWVGRSEAEVRANWGPPQHVYSAERGLEAIQYVYYEELFQTLSGRRDPIVWECYTSFKLDAARIVRAYAYRGNHCFPPEGPARRGGGKNW